MSDLPPKDPMPSEVVPTQEEPDEEVDREHPEKAAAEGREGQRAKHPQDETDSETFDSDDHSDTPGPFGTG
jgi:hypothetical protein